MLDSYLQTLGIENNRQLAKFYRLWSINASKLIKQYAQDKSLDWFNTKWRNKSKEIPFFIRTKAPKSFKGSIWFSSRPVNYAYAKGAQKFATKKRIPRKTEVKPVFANGRWFTPKSYSPNINNIERSIIEDAPANTRFFASKTSHDKAHKYKRPQVWYQTKSGDIGYVSLKEQLGDKIYLDDETYRIISDAFTSTLEEGKYL